MDDNHAARARSFGKQASTYERLRPGYPVAAIEAFLPEPGKRVVDVGAGTGKLTGALLNAGHSVIAVEPDPDMRATLIEHLPGVDARQGVGEHCRWRTTVRTRSVTASPGTGSNRLPRLARRGGC